MIKKFLPIMSRTFSNDLFALKKSSILLIENLTIPEMFFGNQAFNEHNQASLVTNIAIPVTERKLTHHSWKNAPYL